MSSRSSHGIIINYFPGLNGRMKKIDYVIWIGLAAAAGSTLGVLADRENPVKGGLFGAAAGVAAGMAAAGVYGYVIGKEIPYYTSLSPLYEEAEVA